MTIFCRRVILLTILFFTAALLPGKASKLVSFKIVDESYLMLRFYDGEVFFTDDGKGEHAYLGHTMDTATSIRVLYGEALNLSEATNPSGWEIGSISDANYMEGLQPTDCFRQTKVNGTKLHFDGAKFYHSFTHEHIIYLKLPVPLSHGHEYSVQIAPETNSDSTLLSFSYDNFLNTTEAIHVNLNGYNTKSSIKSADVYMWLGDGGYRDYSAFNGKPVYIYDLEKSDTIPVGNLNYYMGNSSSDVGYYNLTASPVWTCDFSSLQTRGLYKLVVDGIGCSQPFAITDSAYYEPYATIVKGYYYMRLGEDSVNGITPVPRQPLFIPHVSPPDCKILITSFHPYMSGWNNYSGDRWDRAEYFENYVLDGQPENTHVRGGHSDAYDWDRHLGHVSNIYDMLLPYIITNGGLNDDNLGIVESGNGIPDLLDEVRNEVDFWLSLRYKGGYSHGVSCPHHHQKHYNQLDEVDKSKMHTMYQAGNTALAAWANAMNSAMLAYCFKLHGNMELMNEYLDSALVAYNYASALPDPMLNTRLGIADGFIRGRDMKMSAAAFFYNITGNTTYEDVVKAESVCKTPTSEINNYGTGNSYEQTWATAAYLFTSQEIHYPDLWENMKASIIHQAKEKETNFMFKRPSRRATNVHTGYFRTAQNVQRSIIAHAITDDPTEKKLFEDALILEADWGLGRNPLNYIEMTTASTPLSKYRSIENAFTTGHDDGTPGLHPGHTPYLNTDDWFCGSESGCPSVLHNQCYPSFQVWPRAQGYFNTRYFWAHSEFTPRQTMRGKIALYTYLNATFKKRSDENVVYLTGNAENGEIIPGDGMYYSGDTLTLSAIPYRGYRFSHWSGDVDTAANPLFITLDANTSVTAHFEALPSYTLSVEGGKGSGSYFQDESISIRAEVPPYHIFTAWTGDTEYIEDINSQQTILTMPARNVNVKAEFTEFDIYSLSVINGNGSGDYYETEEVAVSADAPEIGYIFDRWIGDTLGIEHTDRSYTNIIMPSKDVEITAAYKSTVNVELYQTKQVKISPNPAKKGNIMILGESLKGEYRIYDINGKIYQNGRISENALIDIQLLDQGTYILVAETFWGIFVVD